jgi:hypothetical protein
MDVALPTIQLPTDRLNDEEDVGVAGVIGALAAVLVGAAATYVAVTTRRRSSSPT